MINRLDELQSSAGTGLTLTDKQPSSNESHLSTRMSSDTVVTVAHTQTAFIPIESGIENITKACHRIEQLYSIKRTGLPAEQKDALTEVDSIVMQTTQLIRNVKKSLDSIKKKRKTTKNRKVDDLWFNNMFRLHANNYRNAIMQYQESTAKFKDAVCEDFTRQAKIVDPQISQVQIQKMLQSGDPAQYLQTNIMAISAEILHEVAELEEEHQRVKNLENIITEIQELFNACALLVAEAQEKLNEIEQNVEFTLGAAETGKKELKKAEVYAVQTRKTKIKTIVAAFLCLGLIALILWLVFLRK